jgi:hypothetical protein
MLFDLASSATANSSRTFFAKSLRADGSDAKRVRVCGAWSEAISDMSSVLRFIAAACPTLNCQKIRPREKTMPHPATIHALVFEFKISFFLSNKNLYGTQASLPAARQASVSAAAMHAGSVRTTS